MNWARHRRASQKLRYPSGPRRAVVGLLNSPKRGLQAPVPLSPKEYKGDGPLVLPILPALSLAGTSDCYVPMTLTKCEKRCRLLGLGMQYFTAAYRAVYHRAQDSVIQLYFRAGFWFPKSCRSDRLGHLTGAP